jgi:hypothetical protein
MSKSELHNLKLAIDRVDNITEMDTHLAKLALPEAVAELQQRFVELTGENPWPWHRRDSTQCASA